MSRILYHCPDGRSFRPLWALEELGLDYELRVLPFPPRFRAPEYLRENPLGTIPLYIDGETRMRESVAICAWLAERYGPELAVRSSDPGYDRYLDALIFGEASLTWPQGVCLLYSRFEREERRLPRVAEDMRMRIVTLLDDTVQRLGAGPFVLGEGFTMADISIGYALKLAGYCEVPLPGSLQLYYERLCARPAFQRAEARQKEG